MALIDRFACVLSKLRIKKGETADCLLCRRQSVIGANAFYLAGIVGELSGLSVSRLRPDAGGPSARESVAETVSEES